MSASNKNLFFRNTSCSVQRFSALRGSGLFVLTLNRSTDFKYSTKVSIEALHPLSCKTDVTGWRSVFSVVKSLSVKGFAVVSAVKWQFEIFRKGRKNNFLEKVV